METSASSAGSNLGDESEGAGFPGSELDLAGRSRMANLRTTMFGASAEPARVDRFVVLETIGAGGMGVVHAAYDPRLDRKVALKLVKPEAAAANGSGEARLLREAQAMARLSHPNVVQIHEVGAWDGRVFIAMELVPGRSLAAWLAEQRRAWREVVRMFVDAGRGLAAAHAVGIVHRDFKPENVLVGDDGRVRVTDFGLARSGESVSADGERWREPGGPLAEIVAGTSTGTAAFAGTPRFMSPEQFLGEPATAASDQFSFCVALHLALHGVHPFAGEDRETLARAVIAGERREPPRVRTPRRLHKALVRGLSRAPERRFAGMDELLAEMEPDSPWQWMMPAALFLATGAGALGWMMESDPCADASELLAGAWDPARRVAAEQAFTGSGVVGANQLWTTASRELDAYAGAVATSYTRSCRAQRRGEITSNLHDRRVACLRRRVAVVRGVTDAIITGEPEALRSAPGAASELDRPGACEDDQALLQDMDSPPPALMLALTRVREEIDRARSRQLVGDPVGSNTLVDEALAMARELGHAPTMAEALYQRGRLALLGGKFAAAEAALGEAMDLATSSRHDALVDDLWGLLIQAMVLGSGDTRGVDVLLSQAAAWQRRSTPSPLSQARLARTRGLVYSARGDSLAAEAANRDALELSESVLGPDHLQVAIDRGNYADRLDTLGRTEEALALYRQVMPRMIALVGPAHNLTADAHFNLGVALLNEGSAEALADSESELGQAREVYVALHGEDAVEVAVSDVVLARVAQLRGHEDAAVQRIEAALRIFAHYPDHMERATALGLHGALLFAQGRFDEALRAHTQARAIGLARAGEHSPDVGAADCNIADVLRVRGDNAGAIGRYEAGIESLRRVYGPKTPYLVEPLLGVGEARLAQGQSCEALLAVEQAVSLMWAYEADASDIAEALAIRDTAASRCK